jgi:hypothetical protein
MQELRRESKATLIITIPKPMELSDEYRGNPEAISDE